jgi:peptide deformylase
MLPLVYHPDDRLTVPVDPVAHLDDDLVQLTSGMIETMRAANGIGLAGPQVGRMQRLFVVHVPNDEPRVFVNPEIVAVSPDEWSYEEGCLSIPGIYADVTRPTAITVEAIGADGNAFRLDADGILARVILHEYDHLEGILFLDHLSRRKRERLMRSYRSPAEVE